MPVSYLDRRSAELHAYLPELTRRPDFDAFWDEMLERARAVPLARALEPVDYPNRRLRVLDVAYDGFDGTRIHGWLIRPITGVMFDDLPERLPCLVHYHGFGGSRGRPADFAAWTQLGMAVLSVDVRDQRGSTGNAAHYSSGSATNVATKGLLDRYEYYYGAVYLDSVKAIDLVMEQPWIDPQRIVIAGRSQGGGIASAVSAIDHRPCAALVDVPSNSNIERRSEIKVAAYSGTGAFGAVNDYLREHPDQVDRVFETLSYFDTMNMADRITTTTIASVALDDIVCPPECYFATYNRITAEKEMTIYPFYGHSDGAAEQRERQIRFLAERVPGGQSRSPASYEGMRRDNE